ncbi:hypothetical protein [Sutterella massiliensis]|nr:hypothetical protein [Sutterella massiliensis]
MTDLMPADAPQPSTILPAASAAFDGAVACTDERVDGCAGHLEHHAFH